MTKPRSVAATANDNSIPGSRLEDLSVPGSKLENGTITQNKFDSSVAFSPPPGSVSDAEVSPSAAISSAKLSYLAASTAEARAVSDKLRDIVSVLDFIPEAEHAAIRSGTSTYDATADLQAAFDYASANTDRIYVPAGIYNVSSGLTLACNLIGDGRKASILKHDGVTPITLLTITSHQTANIFDIGLWGAGYDSGSGSWRTFCLLDVGATTRGWECNRVEIGRYAVNGYGAEWGMRIVGFSYYKAVINTLFDFNKHSVYIANSGNSLGRQFVDCRFEHASGYSEVVIGNGGTAAFYECAFQFGQGSGITTEPDTVDEVSKVISGNTASGSFVVKGCTFEKENRGPYRYTLDGSDTLVGHAQVLRGSCTVDECFFTGSTGESAQAVLIDVGSGAVTNCSTSSSQTQTFLRGGLGLTGATFYKNRASGGATTTQYELNDTDIELVGEANNVINPARFPATYTSLNGLKSIEFVDNNLENNAAATLRIDLEASGAFTVDVLSQAAYPAQGGVCTAFTVQCTYYSTSTTVETSVIRTQGNPVTVDTSNVTSSGGYILLNFTTTRSSTGTTNNNNHYVSAKGRFTGISLS